MNLVGNIVTVENVERKLNPLFQDEGLQIVVLLQATHPLKIISRVL